MKTKHTPGPWGVSIDKVSVIKDCGAQGNLILVCPPLPESHLEAFPFEKEMESNARLIAAAPDLLEALDLAERALENVTNENFKMQALAYIKKAIAKATGGDE
jgi:hypothetical protein